jgi:hypothetical protein
MGRGQGRWAQSLSLDVCLGRGSEPSRRTNGSVSVLYLVVKVKFGLCFGLVWDSVALYHQLIESPFSQLLNIRQPRWFPRYGPRSESGQAC